MAGHKWQKGQSGNPGGRPRVPDDLKKSCRRLAAKGMKVLEEIISSKDTFGEDGKRTAMGASPSEKIAAIKLAMEYGYGKPVQPIEGKGEDGNIVVEIVRFGAGTDG